MKEFPVTFPSREKLILRPYRLFRVRLFPSIFAPSTD